MSTTRRGFLAALAAGATVAATELVLPHKKFFLPPAGGWYPARIFDLTWEECMCGRIDHRSWSAPESITIAVRLAAGREAEHMMLQLQRGTAPPVHLNGERIGTLDDAFWAKDRILQGEIRVNAASADYIKQLLTHGVATVDRVAYRPTYGNSYATKHLDLTTPLGPTPALEGLTELVG
jgi:hypothetical protein